MSRFFKEATGFLNQTTQHLWALIFSFVIEEYHYLRAEASYGSKVNLYVQNLTHNRPSKKVVHLTFPHLPPNPNLFSISSFQTQPSSNKAKLGAPALNCTVWKPLTLLLLFTPWTIFFYGWPNTHALKLLSFKGKEKIDWTQQARKLSADDITG